jgi:uncharacterized membrane protein HdeD (DUF308 family)
VIFGTIPAVLPGEGLLSLVCLIGIYAILFGIAQIVLALRAWGLQNREGRRVA